jgi:fumarylacetoacetase
LRRRLHELLRAGHPDEARHREVVGPRLVPAAEVEMRLPAQVGDYTDFYASVHHATNVGRMMRPDNPLLPNYRWVPIGYHGRASSIVVSGTPVCRPCGQTRPDGLETPVVGPTRRLDYEVEVGAFIGPGNRLGHAIPLADADQHLFGLCLVNDWSARDVQAWEYQPLGPFLAKNFATSVSPWVVTLDALAPFRVPPSARLDGDPRPLPYLDGEEHRIRGGIDIALEVWLSTARMREAGAPATRLSHASFAGMYWTLPQLVAHHTMGGCNLRPGDLLASGTVSGPDPSMRGCLLELSWRGQHPLEVPGGERRAFLEDGDEIIIRGACNRAGAVRIGFGECRGRVMPASA